MYFDFKNSTVVKFEWQNDHNSKLKESNYGCEGWSMEVIVLIGDETSILVVLQSINKKENTEVDF